MSQLLQIKNLKVTFRSDGALIRAVNGISYSVDEGESIAIVGESGSGKSVGVMALMGLIPNPPGKIESGEVFFKGRDLLKASSAELRAIRGKEIAMVFQDPMTSLNPVLPVGLQLTEAIQAHMGLDKDQARERAIKMLALTGLPNPEQRIKDFPFQFSGGQRQRIMIAMALVCTPDLLIADEPTTALDVTIQAQIVELMRELQSELGMAIIWISHNLGLVAGVVTRVIVMYSGFIVEQAPVDDLYERPLHPYTLGLLHAVPHVDVNSQNRLASIEGMPPDLRKPISGCPFAPRCPYRIEKCAELPPLFDAGDGRQSACWRWQELQTATTFGETL
ncbi:MAG: ABC transporter ATP-binding protein [Chloroflexota bacterium]|nr:MAG: ABC transporter ATP-binding protein [Chloroflexota bacterium]